MSNKIRIVAEVPGGYKFKGGYLKSQLLAAHLRCQKAGHVLCGPYARCNWTAEVQAMPAWERTLWLFKRIYPEGAIWIYREPRHNRKRKSRYIQHLCLWGMGQKKGRRNRGVEANIVDRLVQHRSVAQNEPPRAASPTEAPTTTTGQIRFTVPSYVTQNDYFS